MSPKKRQMRVEFLSVVRPDAASHTSTGKTRMMHTDSNTPLRQNGEPPSIKGTWKSASRAMAQIQNAPCTPSTA